MKAIKTFSLFVVFRFNASLYVKYTLISIFHLKNFTMEPDIIKQIEIHKLKFDVSKLLVGL